jgi:hypothetical protein
MFKTRTKINKKNSAKKYQIILALKSNKKCKMSSNNIKRGLNIKKI